MWEYRTQLDWKPGTEEATSRVDGKPDWPISAPPEFGGNGACWSPEDALVSAVESCLLLTVLFFVGKMKIGLLSYRSDAVGVMEKTPGGLRFTSIEISISAEVAAEEDMAKMQEALERAEAACPVAQALKTAPKARLEVRVGAAS